jgi:hypothetical protein
LAQGSSAGMAADSRPGSVPLAAAAATL